MFNPYVKALLTAASILLAGLFSAYDDSVLTTSEIIGSVVVALAGMTIVFSSATFKWLWGAGIAGVTALGIALQDDMISAQEWITIVGAFFGSLILVYSVKNADEKPGTPQPVNRPSKV